MSGNNGLAVFVGIVVAALAVSAVAVFFSRSSASEVAAAPAETISTPAPVVVTPVAIELPAEAIRVSAVSLGQPRLAVLNGKQVAERDSLKVLLPQQAAAVDLTVIEIADGHVALTDGTRLFTARLKTFAARSTAR